MSFPVEVEAVSPGRGNFIDNTPATPLGPFAFGGALYLFLYTPALQTELVKSTDGGRTWAVLNAANQPAATGGAGYIDIANSRIVFFYPVANAFNYQIFDLVAETWGAPVIPGGAAPVNVSAGYGAYVRPDGTVALLYLDSTAGGTISCAILSGTLAWVTSFAVNTNAPVGTTQDGFAVMDASGRLHVFFAVAVPPGPQCYQAVEASNALGQFTVLANSNNLYQGTPAIVGNSVVMPTLLGPFPGPPPSFNPVAGTVWIGTPLSAPVWSESGSIFPAADGEQLTQTNFGTSAPFLLFTGDALYCLAVMGDRVAPFFNNAYLQLSSTRNLTSPGLGWSDATIYQTPAVAVSPAFQTLIRVSMGSGSLIAFDANDASATEAAFFMPVAGPGVKLFLRGVKRRRADQK